MTHVDFYILQDIQPQACPLFACKLTEKAYKKGHQVFINTQSDQQLRHLDDLLWTFRAGSFLPHAVYTGAGDDSLPILLGHALAPETASDVLVNLADAIPPFFSRFSRVAELVGGDDSQRSAARERYRFYKDRGYTLGTHHI